MMQVVRGNVQLGIYFNLKFKTHLKLFVSRT